MAKAAGSVVFCLIFLFCNEVLNLELQLKGSYKLDIIHYNDFHARYEETSLETPTCRFNNNSCLGGFPRLYHEIQVLLKEKPKALVLNVGDSFQGTYWYTLLKWNITQEFMNIIPHDAHAIGNHEFDDGPENLAHYLSALKAPVLAANMDSSKEPVLQGLYKPSIIVKRNGRNIGIIGLITQDTKILSSAGNVEFLDPGEVTKREALALHKKGVDIVILLSHCGLAIDKKLAQDYGEYIDVIVGGHSHSLLWNGKPPSYETAEGPYPIFVQSSSSKKHKVLIVQAAAFSKYLGNLTVYFDHKGDFISWEGGPIFLNRSIKEDKNIKAKLAPYATIVHEAENQPIGRILTTLRFEDCVFGECPLGNLLVDAFYEYAKPLSKSSRNTISFIQRGNIQSSILQGNITAGSLLEVLPFINKIQTFELSGKYVLEALERSFSDAWSLSPFKGPWVLQVAGLKLVYDLSKPDGNRLVSAVTNDGKEMEEDAIYQVIASDFLADGGDGFSMFKTGKKNVKILGRDRQAIEEFIRAHSPIDMKNYGRIVLINNVV